VTPPEVVALIASGRVEPGRALDIGCGSGATARHLARHGFAVVGIDFSHAALHRATLAARAENLACLFIRGDATDFRFARVSATLAVDVGCFHSFSPEGRASYRDALAATLAPGGYYLLYTFLCDNCPSFADVGAAEPSRETPAITYADIAAFAPYFALRWTGHGEDRARHSAWFLMQRI
jgi:cyclopropane fatty-acyl-phospholipid synthase-like methyltransferase